MIIQCAIIYCTKIMQFYILKILNYTAFDEELMLNYFWSWCSNNVAIFDQYCIRIETLLMSTRPYCMMNPQCCILLNYSLVTPFML